MDPHRAQKCQGSPGFIHRTCTPFELPAMPIMEQEYCHSLTLVV